MPPPKQSGGINPCGHLPTYLAGTKRIELLPMVSKTTVLPLYDMPMPLFVVILREVSGSTLTSVSRYLTSGAASRS